MQLIWQYLSKIPVPRVLPQDLAILAGQIISAKKAGEDATELEKRANEIIYNLYGLMVDEIVNIED